MKTIGLIGGTSWLSTIDYYRVINSLVNKRLGGNEAAKIILHSVNYGEIVSLTQRGDWDAITTIICDAAMKTERAGADCLLLCANTMHRIAKDIESVVSIPLLHIADITARAIREKGLNAVLLLGTRFTMFGDFYSKSLQDQGVKLIVPAEEDSKLVHNSIYDELGKNIFLPATKQLYLDIIDRYNQQGAEGVILGCTEIPLLLQQQDCPVPLFDTTVLHATAAVDFALS